MQPFLERVFNFLDKNLTNFIPDLNKWKKALAERRNQFTHHDVNTNDVEFDVLLALFFSGYWIAIYACLALLNISTQVSSALAESDFARHEAEFIRAGLSNLN